MDLDAIPAAGYDRIELLQVADAVAIVFLRGKRPNGSVLDLAGKVSIPVLATELGMFDVCGRLHAAGMKGVC